MNRREFLTFGGIGAALIGIDSLVASASSKNRPNIVLCMADDQGWGDMAYNGHPVLKTPNFDDLAATGLRFDRFYAAAPVCSPTRGSVLTGRHPNGFGCFQWGFPLRPQEVTIAIPQEPVRGLPHRLKPRSADSHPSDVGRTSSP